MAQTREATLPDVSVIVLCYRAGESILLVVEPLHEELTALGETFELVLVANYWPADGDSTPGHASSFAHANPHVRVVSREKEGGMGWDMRSGLETASGRYLVVMDGDAQNPSPMP